MTAFFAAAPLGEIFSFAPMNDIFQRIVFVSYQQIFIFLLFAYYRKVAQFHFPLKPVMPYKLCLSFHKVIKIHFVKATFSSFAAILFADLGISIK